MLDTINNMGVSIPSYLRYINTLRVHDMIDFNNMVFKFNVNKNLLPDHMLSYFERVGDSYNIIHAIETIYLLLRHCP